MGRDICLSGILFRGYKDYGATHLNSMCKFDNMNNLQMAKVKQQ